MLNMAAFALVLVIGILYITQVNRSSTLGYEMRDLERGIEALEVQNAQLEHQIAELQSVDQVTHRLQMLGMVDVSEVSYASSASSGLAVNR